MYYLFPRRYVKWDLIWSDRMLPHPMSYGTAVGRQAGQRPVLVGPMGFKAPWLGQRRVHATTLHKQRKQRMEMSLGSP